MGITGVWRFDNNSDLVSRLLSKLLGAGQGIVDKSAIISDSGIEMFCYELKHNVKAQPQISRYLPEHQLSFIAEARLENSADLISKLALPQGSLISDSDLILHSFVRWGKDCVSSLRGRWSFAVFDHAKEELFLARDQVGYTSIYYSLSADGFYFSASLKALLSILPKAELNELHFIRNLTLWDVSQPTEDTYFKNVFSLPNAHTLTVNKFSLTTNKYWHPEHTPLLRYKNINSYTDEMMERFVKSVKNKLDDDLPVASMLSGGLDSGSVSYVASEILKSKGKSLTTFSHIPQFKHLTHHNKTSAKLLLDETPVIQKIVQKSQNIHPYYISSDGSSIVQSWNDLLDIYSAPIHGAGNIYWLFDLYRKASDMGYDKLLTGEGGNGSISFSGSATLLPFFDFQRMIRHPRAFLYNQIKKPLLYQLNSWRHRKDFYERSDLGAYIKNIFVNEQKIREYNIKEDIALNKKSFDTPTNNIVDQKHLLLELYNLRSSFGAACSSHFNIELCDPTTDVDLMDYFFKIPNNAFFDKDYNNRMLVKRMMKGKLPDSVLYETRKGLQSSDIVQRVLSQKAEFDTVIEILQQSPAANYYLDIQKLKETWRNYLKQEHKVSILAMQRLCKGILFALFLQKHFD